MGGLAGGHGSGRAGNEQTEVEGEKDRNGCESLDRDIKEVMS